LKEFENNYRKSLISGSKNNNTDLKHINKLLRSSVLMENRDGLCREVLLNQKLRF
jgi:hypothetical protein